MHLYLAHEYTGVVVANGRFNGNGFSQAFLFEAVGVLLLGLAAALAFGGARWQAFAWGFGGLVMAVALFALLAYRLGSPGEIGPIPNMSNSTWLPIGKPVSGLANLAFVALSLSRRSLRDRPHRG